MRSSPCPRCGGQLGSIDSHCGACGQQRPDAAPEDWIGQLVDEKYKIEAVLGVGGMGMVFQARRVLVGDRVALKLLFPRFLRSPLQRRLFRDEAIASARLSHPNVVTIFDAELDSEGQAYIAMELLKGRSFKSFLLERAPMQPEELLPLAVQICQGLEAAHQAQIVHRDLKPDNIFLEGESQRVKLVDFGIAAMLDVEQDEEQFKLLGTLRYMAPEQCLGNPVDARCDLYALGVLLYESLTRRRATGRSLSAVLREPVQAPNQLLSPEQQLPLALEGLLLSLLEKDPARRPESARVVAEHLQEILAPPPQPLPRALLFIPLILALGALLLALL